MPFIFYQYLEAIEKIIVRNNAQISAAVSKIERKTKGKQILFCCECSMQETEQTTVVTLEVYNI